MPARALKSPPMQPGAALWGFNLKYYQHRQGLSNAELARRSGVQENTICRLRQGVDTTTRILRKLAVGLRISLQELMFGPTAKPHHDHNLMLSEVAQQGARDAVEAFLRIGAVAQPAHMRSQLATAEEEYISELMRTPAHAARRVKRSSTKRR